jgi:small multidrug resistance pump
MRTVLLAAAAYSVLWGGFVVFFPLALFRVLGMEPPNYPQIWQCVGMIVGVYGVGYAATALDPVRHWPVVLSGLLGKILGPIGFLSTVVEGTLPLSFGLTLLTNDLIW